MSNSAAANPEQGRKLEGEQEENPAKRAVLGVLPTQLRSSPRAQTKRNHCLRYSSQSVPSPIPSPDASKVPVPQEDEGDAEDSRSHTRERELTLNTQPIMKNYMDKFFNQTVFALFKKHNAEVTQAIANHMQVDLPSKEKLEHFLEHKPNNAEVIALIQAHFNTTTVPMVKNNCKNIDDLFHSLPARTTALHQSKLVGSRAETSSKDV